MGGAPGGPGSGDRLTTPDAPFSALSSEGKGLGDIFFDFDRYTIRADAQPVLEANASRLKTISGKIVIEGHCDERGTEAYNLVLGEKRARATKRYLEDLGVPSTRMKIISYGEIRPFCRERDEQCYQLNRRAHFVVQ
jgi:peptidoglycan-associated lipoprotein